MNSKTSATGETERLSRKLQKAEKQIEILENLIEDRTRELYYKGLDLERKNSELQSFLYMASHDLQEPLRSISGFTSILKEELVGFENEEIEECLDFILKSTVRMNSLIHSLLDYSRIGRSSV